MNIIEIKNNLVKLSYNEDITLSSFIKISDLRNSYIAQILHLEASRIGKVAIARIIFNFKCGIQAYDGSIPSIQAEVEVLDDEFFLNTLDKSDPLLMGKLAQKDSDVVVSSRLLMDKPIICAEKSYQYSLLLENLLKQNEENSRRTVVIDVTGDVRGNKLVATEDFKIPLDKNSIDYIFDRGFDDLTAENKAFIQDIFSELNDYIKTVEYIPFNDFNAVIDYEFKRTQQLQLIILKNRLTQFEKLGIFAQNANEFKVLKDRLESDNTLIVDISKLSDSLQTEYINYIYACMNEINANFYAFVSLNNNNSKSETLHTVLGCKNVFPLIACPYSYKYLTELKQCSKNMFMFTPIKQQADFGAYNIYLNKLAEDEYILYGKSTKFTPLIVKLEEINDFPKVEKEPSLEETSSLFEGLGKAEETMTEVEPVTEQIVEPVQAPVQEETPIENILEDTQVEDEQPVEDNNNLTFAELLNNPTNEIEDIEVEQEETPEIIESEVTTPEEELPMEAVEEAPIEQASEIVEDTTETEPQEESQEIDYEAELKAQLADINISDDDIADIVAQTKGTEIVKGVNDDIGEIAEENNEIEESEEKQSLNPSDLFKASEETPADADEPEEDSDLTDEDLDMIESLGVDVEEPAPQSIPQENIVDTPVQQPSAQPQEEKKTSITDEILQEEAEKKAQEEAQKVDPVEEMIEKPEVLPEHKEKAKALETKEAHTPIVPVYSAEIPDEDVVESDPINQGDRVEHPEFGRGIVEKIINYGDRTLCSVNFEQVGRRLLDPKISELKKL